MFAEIRAITAMLRAGRPLRVFVAEVVGYLFGALALLVSIDALMIMVPSS